ncbi:ribbon-helix-helix domain-containing protein [Pelagibacterium sp. 26DY04]|uniref:ribbon-helix-helix domain-containing protein n=1 Tax=Pelagibacterium sp. 26DY04 TaxID=2967130 RepID=UPI002815DDAF|nr:ribbon-helix-helix domain-containing protein [Pelagibacterium sp. 26DY04]WMT85809.1 ribbon-helix-helix domain-containing protein [Pelagibacterium sp. 26DY04]
MRKRSLTIAGHRTSIALEPQFWDALETIAAERDISLPTLIAEIDEQREDTNLSSSIRVAVLIWYQQRSRL